MSETSKKMLPKRRVIVADDEEQIATTLAIILNHSGFDARAVFCGKQVIELLETFEPEILIVDVVMPDLIGIEAAIAVRSRPPNCKILLFSGQAAAADLLDRAKACWYELEIVAKPIHPADLLAKLGGLCDVLYSRTYRPPEMTFLLDASFGCGSCSVFQ